MEPNEHSRLLKSNKDTSDKENIRAVPFLKCAIFCGCITFLVFVVLAASSPIISQYVHAKLLRSYNVNSTAKEGGSSCSANSTASASEDDPLVRAQKETSNFLLMLAVTNNIPAVFVNVIFGSWSDYLGRKLLFLVPAFGVLLKNVFCVVIMYFEMDIKYFYIAYAIDGLGGSACAFLVASFTYTADITSSGRGRIIATTAVEMCLALAACTAMLLTGFLIPAIGYLDLSIVMASISLLSCVIALLLPETRDKRPDNPWSPITHFRNVFGFYVHKGKEKEDRRIIYILLMTIFLFTILSILGRIDIETLYCLGEPFCWDSVQIGYFGALRIGLASLGSMAAVKILQHYIRDEIIALIGAVDTVIACVLEGLATTGWMLYLVPLAGMVSGTTAAIIRGTMSRMTSQNQQGAIFAGVGFVETIMKLVCQVLFTGVYSATVASFSGAAFLLMASFGFITAVLIIIWIAIMPRHRDIYTIHVSKEEEVSITKSGHFCSSQIIS